MAGASTMKKIPVLIPKNKCLSKVIPGEVTVKNVTHFALKIDGTSCMINDGKPFCRYDAKLFKRKRGRIVKTFTLDEIHEKLPIGAIACQEPDIKSGHYPHWVPVDATNPAHQYILEGFKSLINPVDGTYECIGEKIQQNPHNIVGHTWIHHQSKELIFEVDPAWKTDAYNTFKDLFSDFQWEGLVAYNGNEPVAKIRRSDFGYDAVKYQSIKSESNV